MASTYNTSTAGIGNWPVNQVPLTVSVPLGSAVSLTSGVAKTLMFLDIPAAGNYMVSSSVDYTLNGLTATEFRSGISLITDTLPTQAGGSGLGTDALNTLPMLTTLLSNTLQTNNSDVPLIIPGPTRIYLVARVTFTLGTVSGYGSITVWQQ